MKRLFLTICFLLLARLGWAALDGTNTGFLSTAPVNDPGGTGSTYSLSNTPRASKFTTPAGTTKIVEIGVWVDSISTPTVGGYAGIYAHNSGTDLPSDIVGSAIATTGDFSVGWNHVDCDIAVSASTVYWIAWVQDEVMSHNYVDGGNVSGGRRSYISSGTTLPASWSSSGATSDSSLAYYAIVETFVGSSSSRRVILIQ